MASQMACCRLAVYFASRAFLFSCRTRSRLPTHWHTPWRGIGHFIRDPTTWGNMTANYPACSSLLSRSCTHFFLPNILPIPNPLVHVGDSIWRVQTRYRTPRGEGVTNIFCNQIIHDSDPFSLLQSTFQVVYPPLAATAEHVPNLKTASAHREQVYGTQYL